MKAILHTYTCFDCDVNYVAACESGAYGQFILSSVGTSEQVYMNALDDCIYDEVSNYIKKMPILDGLDDSEHAEILQKVFKIACDKDSKGFYFDLYLAPRCPNCGSKKRYDCKITDPVEYVDLDYVTHTEWKNLSESEKNKRLEKEVNKHGPFGSFPSPDFIKTLE